MKLSNKFFFLILFSIFILIPIGSFPLDVSANNTTQYISATDILKNFKFESIGGEPIVNEGAFNNKLRFDTQSAWILYQDDVTVLSKQEIGGSTKLKYRIVLRNKINIYTNVRLNQMAQNLLEKTDEFVGSYYRHNNLGGSIDTQWEGIIEWEHWDFGDIYNYNWQNNYFDGRIVMSFDIDDNPIPESIGANTETEYGYIAVSEAGIVTNSYGKMSDDMPDIVVLSPSEYESEKKDDSTYTSGSTADDDHYKAIIDPNINLVVGSEPIQSFDASILPDTAGSSMDPTNKDGSALWDPEREERSMTGCLIHYDLGSISPIVYRWGGTLTYTEHDLETEDYLVWDWSGIREVVKTNHYYKHDYIKYGDVALHGINRYIQVDMIVAFIIWTDVKLGTLTDAYENLRLNFPEEYYDELIWSTLVGGWSGSTIEEYGKNLFEIKWLDDLLDFFSFDNIQNILLLVAIIAISIVILYVALKFRKKKAQVVIMKR